VIELSQKRGEKGGSEGREVEDTFPNKFRLRWGKKQETSAREVGSRRLEKKERRRIEQERRA